MCNNLVYTYKHHCKKNDLPTLFFVHVSGNNIFLGLMLWQEISSSDVRRNFQASILLIATKNVDKSH